MNDLRNLIDILEDIGSEPEVGDVVEMEFGDTLIETVIEDITEDGIVVHLDETALEMIIDARKQYIAESKQGVAEGQNINEAYIKSVNDAVDVLANLRKIAKHIEIGTPYNGNLANQYVNDVWDVYSWLENRANVYDPKLKAILNDVFAVRKQAKDLETGTNSGQNRQFANQIVNTLYPLIQWIEMNVSDKQGVAEGSELKTFKVIYRNAKTGLEHTRNIIANNKNAAISRFKSKGLDIVSIKDMGLADKSDDERGLQYRDVDEQDVAEGSLNEIGYSDELDSSNFSQSRIIKLGQIDGQIDGHDVFTVSSGNQTIYFLKDGDRISAFIGFENGNLKNIKNFTNAAGVVRLLLGYIVHIKREKIKISPDEPLTSDGLKWVIGLISSPRGLKITDQSGQPVDVNSLKKEWMASKSTRKHGGTGIIIGEHSEFGNRLRLNENYRKKESLLMPHMFYNITKQCVLEDKMRFKDFEDRSDELHEKIRLARNSGNKELAAKLQQEYDDLHDEAKKGLLPESEELDEAEYQGRKVSLGKPFLTPDGPKKRSVYVKNKKGNVVKVNFGQKGVKIKKNIPGRRKSFRARHNCSTAKDRTTARYWSCRYW